MKLFVVNGSPRKSWNTSTLLHRALEGAASVEADTELVHLYDLNYKGCSSCFACKRIGGKSYGKCAFNDDLAPVLQKIEECDALLLGSPIYLGELTGEMRSFVERLVFQYLAYNREHATLFDKRIKIGLIYTMNVNEDHILYEGYLEHFRSLEDMLKKIFGETKSLYVTDTLQFDDYSNYVSDMFDPVAKVERHNEIFPIDCKKAYDLGRWLCKA